MKKNFILTLSVSLFFSVAHSQFSVGMHIGASNKNTVAGLHSQYQFKNRFTVGFNMTTHTDNSNPAFFQSRFGYTVGKKEGLSVQPYIGYSYGIQSFEKTDPGNQFTEGIQLRYKLTRISLIYADINVPAPHLHIFSLGIAGRF